MEPQSLQSGERYRQCGRRPGIALSSLLQTAGAAGPSTAPPQASPLSFDHLNS
ncbi:hypothetical protein H1R20_g11553, partial [Candolleomyces eurysporus]